MFTTTFRTAAAATACSALALLTACESAPMRNDRVYSSGPVQQAPVQADYGRVEGIEVINVQSRPSGAGAILGAVVGAVIGNQFGKGTGRAVGTVAGAVGGGVAGNAIEGRTRRDDEVFRVTVRFDNGSFRSYDYREVGDLRTGDRVKFEEGQLHRI